METSSKSQKVQCSLKELGTCDSFPFERNQILAKFAMGGIDPINLGDRSCQGFLLYFAFCVEVDLSYNIGD